MPRTEMTSKILVQLFAVVIVLRIIVSLSEAGMKEIKQSQHDPVLMGWSYNLATNTVNIKWRQPITVWNAYNIYLSNCSGIGHPIKRTINGSCSSTQVYASLFFSGVVLVTLQGCNNSVSECADQNISITSKNTFLINFTETDLLPTTPTDYCYNPEVSTCLSLLTIDKKLLGNLNVFVIGPNISYRYDLHSIMKISYLKLVYNSTQKQLCVPAGEDIRKAFGNESDRNAHRVVVSLELELNLSDYCPAYMHGTTVKQFKGALRLNFDKTAKGDYEMPAQSCTANFDSAQSMFPISSTKFIVASTCTALILSSSTSVSVTSSVQPMNTMQPNGVITRAAADGFMVLMLVIILVIAV